MPTYQYACTACGHHLEAVQSFADDPLTQCPVCEGRLRKLFGSVGIVFKGPGFYRTDSRSSGNGASGSGGTDGSGKDGSDKGKQSTEKTDSKPASTAGESKSGGKALASSTPAASTG